MKIRENTPIRVILDKLRRRRTRRSGRKRVEKTRSPLSAKSLKCAVQNNRITVVRKTHSRRKESDSVENFPPNNASSSAQSSRRNATKANKRALRERKKRTELNDDLEVLRREVPSVSCNPKAPKVLILKSAKDYVGDLKSSEQKLIREKQEEEKNVEKNEAKVKALSEHREEASPKE